MDKMRLSGQEPGSQPGPSRRQVPTEREEREEWMVDLPQNWGMSSTLEDKLEIDSRYPRDTQVLL